MQETIYQSLDRYLSKKSSRRDFIQAVTALGITSLGAESMLASAQQGGSGGPGDGQADKVWISEGTAGALLVEQLKAAGVKYIFHTNTSGLATLTDAVDTPEMQVIMLTHEGQAISTAMGYTMASGELGFFMGSKVGVGNTVSNLYNAWKDCTPLIVSFGASALKRQEGHDGFEDAGHHLKPTEPFTAWAWGCMDAQTMPQTLRRAMKFAFTPPGAPVTLDFPIDLLKEKIRAPIYELDQQRLRPVFRATSDRIEKAAEMLANAKSPLLILGSELSREGAGEALVALAEKLSVPVCEGETLSSDFPNHHPLFVGDYSPNMRFPKNVDLVINFGSKDGRAAPQGARVIHVSSAADMLGRRNFTDLSILAHASTVISDLSDALDGILTQDRIKRLRAERLEPARTFNQQIREAQEIAMRANFDNAPLSWQRVGYELEKALDQDAVIVPELGSQGPKLLSSLKMGGENKRRIGRSLIGRKTGYALGWGVGMALGAQLALPDRQVVDVEGDGGILFGQTENFWSLSRYDVPLLVVVMNNHSYNDTRIRNLTAFAGQQQFQTGKDLTSYLGDPNIDFAKIAEAYGIKAEKVYDPKDLGPALQRAVKTLRDGRPYLLDLEVERDGLFAQSTWHPEFSVAGLRSRKS